MIFQTSLAFLRADIWANIETEHSTVGELIEELENNDIMIVTNIHSIPSKDRKSRIITKREEIAITFEAVEWVRPATIEFVEEEK